MNFIAELGVVSINPPFSRDSSTKNHYNIHMELSVLVGQDKMQLVLSPAFQP